MVPLEDLVLAIKFVKTAKSELVKPKSAAKIQPVLIPAEKYLAIVILVLKRKVKTVLILSLKAAWLMKNTNHAVMLAHLPVRMIL